MNRTTLLAEIASGRDRLEATLASLSDEAMRDRIDDAWTRRDVLAHFEAWERRVIALLDRLRAGRPADDAVETDALNERYFQRDRHRKLAEVRSAERAAYGAMIAAIDGATDEELFDGTHFAWTDGEPLAAWFRGNSDEHYDEHLEQLTRPAR